MNSTMQEVGDWMSVEDDCAQVVVVGDNEDRHQH